MMRIAALLRFDGFLLGQQSSRKDPYERDDYPEVTAESIWRSQTRLVGDSKPYGATAPRVPGVSAQCRSALSSSRAARESRP